MSLPVPKRASYVLGIVKRGKILIATFALLLGSLALFSEPSFGVDSTTALGEHNAIPITVTTLSGSPICPSFSFSQIPRSPELFVGKLSPSSPQSLCDTGQHPTLAVYRRNWTTHIMTLLHPLMQVPVNAANGPGIIQSAYDPYVAQVGKETWVAFECTGPHIAGAAACA